jgi:hypothetical protein
MSGRTSPVSKRIFFQQQQPHGTKSHRVGAKVAPAIQKCNKSSRAIAFALAGMTFNQ